jgi:hypothetical protein
VSDTWYNIVVVFDRDGVSKAYINGLLQTGTLNISVQPGNVQNIYSLRIGAWTSSQFRLAGKMDEVRIFHAITTISQIQQNYFTGLNKLLSHNSLTQAEYYQRISDLSNNYAEN